MYIDFKLFILNWLGAKLFVENSQLKQTFTVIPFVEVINVNRGASSATEGINFYAGTKGCKNDMPPAVD